MSKGQQLNLVNPPCRLFSELSPRKQPLSPAVRAEWVLLSLRAIMWMWCEWNSWTHNVTFISFHYAQRVRISLITQSHSFYEIVNPGMLCQFKNYHGNLQKIYMHCIYNVYFCYGVQQQINNTPTLTLTYFMLQVKLLINQWLISNCLLGRRSQTTNTDRTKSVYCILYYIVIYFPYLAFFVYATLQSTK